MYHKTSAELLNIPTFKVVLQRYVRDYAEAKIGCVPVAIVWVNANVCMIWADI